MRNHASARWHLLISFMEGMFLDSQYVWVRALGLQSAHVMAMAVQKLFPDAQVTIGPWIEKGFFYDFDMKEPFTEKDLKKIKKEMVSFTLANAYSILLETSSTKKSL